MLKGKVKSKKLFIWGFGIVWLFLICLGLWTLVQYENFPGTPGTPPLKWPTGTAIKPSGNIPTLILFAHPKCPCTRATINELAQIITHCKNEVKTYVVFYKPQGYPNKWARTDIYFKAVNIPGVIVLDDNGNEIRRFQVHTSGQSLLYDTMGQLLFSGGITGARGENGNNIGRQTIISLLKTGKSNISKASVFGCPLLNRKNNI